MGVTTSSTPAESTLSEPARRLPSRPTEELLPADTSMGVVTLRVADLDLMTRYYRDGVRLTVLSDSPATPTRGATVMLGRHGTPIVALEHSAALKHASPHQAGLYHLAVLFETKADLAAAVLSTARQSPRSFTGSADHLVSNAFYFDDPEGNGVELYWDRPRSEWNYVNGALRMASEHLDPNAFLRENLSDLALNDGTRAATVGHVHLSVGDVGTAKEFYAARLGFEIVADLGTALFVSAGGYHHHMAMNVWNSQGARRRQLTLGLGRVRITVPGQNDLDALQFRLDGHATALVREGAALRFLDPWANEIEVSALAG